MANATTPTVLAETAGISVPYASQILSGKRSPARPLAIHIFRHTGWKHDSITSLTDAQIAMLEEVEPWTPPKERTAA